MFAIVGGFLMALYMQFYMTDVPFLDRMGYVFMICVAVMVALGLWKPSDKGLEIDASMFKLDRGFAFGAAIVLATLAVLYTKFW
jgi:solute:Na+ symporter, SSS family